ncbi:DUF2059 domain-containing protein [Sneathiella glossodoripedis]|uniref:DUF2059 domain-containing protein n=1 Tax=Sneathiella glossodoripedis TaxID=418853 RepID=UPI000472629B|nr:DUF2059 domain-containing protein [Sneathiella glossodoripedis]
MRRQTPSFLTAVFLLLFTLPPATADTAEDSKKYAVIYELFEVTGLQHNMITVTQDLIAKEIKKQLGKNPQISASDLQSVTRIFQQTFEERSSEVLQPIANLYAENFTTEELIAILEFQKSPAGQKANRLFPSLFQQGILLGQRWGREVGQTAFERIKKHFTDKGIDI